MKTLSKPTGLAKDNLINRGMLLAFIVITAFYYAQLTFKNSIHARSIVYGEEMRPFVYRALIPLLARGLVALGIDPQDALLGLVIMSAIALVYGFKSFISTFLRK